MTPETLEDILAGAGVSVLPGSGYLTLTISLERSLLNGQPFMRLSTVDPVYPRRRPVNLLPVQVLLGNEGEGPAELLETLAGALRRAAVQ